MMSLIYHPFVHLLFIGIIALFPVVNPVGSAFIANPYLSNLSVTEKRKAVKKITFYAFSICTVSLFAGHWILELFGISIPVIQLAGGIMICKMGWEFLSSDKKDEVERMKDEGWGITSQRLSNLSASELKELHQAIASDAHLPLVKVFMEDERDALRAVRCHGVPPCSPRAGGSRYSGSYPASGLWSLPECGNSASSLGSKPRGLTTGCSKPRSVESTAPS